jgi:hypothetical protein
MKKAKIALAAIAIFGIVGGALAFKAKSSTTFFWTLSSGQDANNALLKAITTTSVAPPTGSFEAYYTLDEGRPATIYTYLTTASN